jgi:hypothetical protein
MITHLPKVARRSAVVIVALAALAIGYLAGVAPRMSADEPIQAGAKSARLKELLQERLTTAREASRFAMEGIRRFGTVEEVREANHLLYGSRAGCMRHRPRACRCLGKTAGDGQKKPWDLPRHSSKQVTVERRRRCWRRRISLQIEIALERAKAQGK